MQTKLTLRMDSELIALAKAQAKRNGKSLSEFVADYFMQFKEKEPPEEDELVLTPIVASMVGILKSKESQDFDMEDYYRYLEEKHR